jgi:hypothetical protein
MSNRIPQARDSVLKEFLERYNVLAIRGTLGIGKTCFLEDFRRVAQEQDWYIGEANRQHNSLVKFLKSLASTLQTDEFDKALNQYLQEFEEVDNDLWIDVFSNSLPSLLSSSAQLAPQITQSTPLAIALSVGSAIFTQETIKEAAQKIKSTKGNWGKILVERPLDYLTQAFQHDLNRDQHSGRRILIVDDFELLSSFLKPWLPTLIKTANNTIWLVAIWGNIPHWLEVDQIWPLDRFDIDKLQQMRSKVIPKTISNNEIAKLQGPPVFGLPILVRERIRELQGMGTHRGIWYPLIEHLHEWLRVEFGSESGRVLKSLTRLSVARYLDEDIVKFLTGNEDLWRWLDKSPLLTKANIAGVDRSVLEIPLRSALAHDLCRQNEKEYQDLHSKMHHRYNESFNIKRRHHNMEAWYHSWCVLPPGESLKMALQKAFRFWNEDRPSSLGNIGQILENIGVERKETSCLRRPGRLIVEASEAFEDTESDRKKRLNFYELIIRKEILTSLDKESQANFWYSLAWERHEAGQYEKSKKACKEYLKIYPEYKEIQKLCKQNETMANTKKKA